jgi:hypothetical protein
MYPSLLKNCTVNRAAGGWPQGAAPRLVSSRLVVIIMRRDDTLTDDDARIDDLIIFLSLSVTTAPHSMPSKTSLRPSLIMISRLFLSMFTRTRLPSLERLSPLSVLSDPRPLVRLATSLLTTTGTFHTGRDNLGVSFHQASVKRTESHTLCVFTPLLLPDMVMT